MKRIYTVSARLDITDEWKEYLEDYIAFYNSVQRRIFHDMRYEIPKKEGISKYITRICKTYNILKRTANSIRYDIQGKIKAYLELKKTELLQMERKIQSVRKKIEKLEMKISGLKPLAQDNRLNNKEADDYRKAKASRYYQKNRMNRLCQKKLTLEKQIRNGQVSICFGSKKLFDKQNRLAENKFKSHGKWLHTFRKKRDSGMFFLGSGNESYGNQILQMKPWGDGFLLQIRKDKPYEVDGKYLFMNVKFQYMQMEIVSAINSGQPMTYRILRKGRKWYLTVMFSRETDIATNRLSGVVGIDYNSGFMELVETNSAGNMVYAEHISLEYHGAGNKAESELKEKLSGIVRDALAKNKDIIIEDLDFKRKKAEQNRNGNAEYNKMLHLFDYHRYTFWLENLCIKYGVRLIKVNPAYTSMIGKQKYSGERKLTVHRAAAFVIARRGQGYYDTLAA